MADTLLFVLIVLPFVAAALVFFLRADFVRRLIVLATGALLAVSSVLLLRAGTFTFTPTSVLGINPDSLIAFADFALLFIILYIAYRMKSGLVAGLTLLQLVPLAVFEFFSLQHTTPTPAIFADNLSLVMVLIISIIGSLIAVYAIPYMKEHEEHLHLDRTKQPQFFFFIVLFLGAMNGLVLSNNILWMYFFWEVTTLCSFALIGHDGTEIAKANAKRALWMNLLGGVAFVFGIIVAYGQAHTLSIQELLQAGATSSIAMLPLALLCFAGFTKSAQVPFQSWLLGAMVAPTPVSALLHSSTMVKAGVYLIVRLAPAYHGTALSTVVAMLGAFTFVAASALAISQSNGKKILAYSTIANLGLIVACAGINTPAAISAAILLIIFHAISKGLLFLCVGSIEQTIGSRDIEDMRGLYAKMPTTAMITAIGILTMLLPPFGVLLSKWIAIEAASKMLLVVVMLAMGSALTVVFWARWAGLLMSGTIGKPAPESKSPLMMAPLYFLLAGSVVMSFLSPVVYRSLISPVLETYYRAGAFTADFGSLAGQAGSFAVLPLFFIFAVILMYAIRTARKSAASAACAPYACGENNPDPTKAQFRLAWLGWTDAKAGNFYLTEYLGEEKLTSFINIAASAILIMMIGGLL